MSNPMVRRVAIGMGGVVVYVAGSMIAYKSIQDAKSDIEDTEQRLRSSSYNGNNNNNNNNTNTNFSFVTNPKRIEQFQKVADVYDQQIGRDEFVMGLNLLRRILLYFHAKGTVLEVGAGTGRNLSYYSSSTVDRVLLIDSSDMMLSKARQKIQSLSSEKPKFACLETDCTKLSNFPNESFDTIVDTFGLCSYDDPIQVLQEMSRVCKKNGKILLLEHGRSKSWNFISNYLDKHAERHAKNWGCVWNRDLDTIIQQSGMNIETLHTFHFGTTYYVVCRPTTTTNDNNNNNEIKE